MFAAERIQKIKKMLKDYKKVDVSDLSVLLSVSEVTIRKDLERLENEGFLTRTYGGAIIHEHFTPEDASNTLDIPELEHKKTIGLIAAHMVNNNEAIFLGTGTTCHQIAKNLKGKKNLTVVTNNITAAYEIYGVAGIKVVLTGGDMKAKTYTDMLVGPAALRTINNIYVDKAFVGVDGISFKRGYTILDSDEAAVNVEIIKSANMYVVVADSTKFNKIAFSQIGQLSLADRIISDESVPEEYIKFCFDNNIQMFTTYKFN